MATPLEITDGASVTLDESAGLQNATATPSPAGDANDNDRAAADLPTVFSTALAGAGTAINAALSGYNGANTGANAFTFSVANPIGLAFSDADGNPLDGDASGFLTTAADVPITLHTDATNNNILYGRANGGAIVFAAYLEETGAPLSGAKLWMVQFAAIKNATTDPDESQNLLNKVFVTLEQASAFSLENAPAGQNLFLTMGDATAAVVISASNAANESTGVSINTGGTVNTSKGGGQTTVGHTNQMIDPTEVMNFTFVTGADPQLTIPNLEHGEAVEESNIQFTSLLGTGGASFDIVQLQKGKEATIKLTTVNTNAGSGDAFIASGQTNTAVPISSVTVKDANGVDITASLTISTSGNVSTITGVKAGYEISYTTTGNHNRVLVENAGTGSAKASFDIGGFQILKAGTSTAEIGSLMNFEDAGPSATLGTPVDTATVNTQDADTKGTNTDSAETDFSTAFSVGSGGYDTDGAGTTTWSFSLSLNNDGEDSLLTSNGTAIKLYVVSGKVIGSTAATAAQILPGNTIFDIAVSTAGVVKLQQFAQIDHALPGVGSNFAAQEAILANDLVDLNASALVTDKDGDSTTATAALDLGGNVRFDDDGPSSFTPDEITLANSGNASGTEDVNAVNSVGADIPGALKFVDGNANDNFLYDTDGKLLKSDGQNIVLSGFGTTTLTAKTATDEETVFTATLNAGTDKYSIDFDKIIGDGARVDFAGAAPVRSGNPTYNVIANVGGTTTDLLFSGGDTNGGAPTAHSVNVSTNGAGVDNQSMNAYPTYGETLRIDFASSAALTGSPLGSSFSMGGHTTVNGYTFLVTQNTSAGTEGTAYIKAYDADDDSTLVGDPQDLVQAITEVMVGGQVIYTLAGGATAPVNINGHMVSAILHDNGVIVQGLNEGATGDGVGGDDPMVKVTTANGFDRIEVSNFAGRTVNNVVMPGTSFDMAPAGFDVPVAGDPFSFELPVQLTDYDGDFSPVAVIGVNITPLPV